LEALLLLMKAWEDVDAKMHQILSGITFA